MHFCLYAISSIYGMDGSEYSTECWLKKTNKANLRDSIAATGLVILLKLDSNCRFFSLCDLEIWWMTSKNNRSPLLYYIKRCASFQIHRRIQTRVRVWKCLILVKIGNSLSRVTLKLDGWSWKTIGCLFYATLSFVHYFKGISEFKLKLVQKRSISQNWRFFVPCDLEIWRMTLKINRAPLLCYFKLCASFLSHHWILIGVTLWKRLIGVKIEKKI